MSICVSFTRRARKQEEGRIEQVKRGARASDRASLKDSNINSSTYLHVSHNLQ